MSFEEELKKIIKIELKDEWKLDLHPDFERKGRWDGVVLKQSKRIVLSYGKTVDCFHGFLHELAHAIEIEKRPNKKGDSHDVFYANTLTILISKYTFDKQRVKKIIGEIKEKLTNIKENLDEEKLREIENFGDELRDDKEEERDDRQKGYMRWAFEDGAAEALTNLKKELGI